MAAAMTMANAIPIASQSARPPRAPIPMLNDEAVSVPAAIMRVMAAAPAPKYTSSPVPSISAQHRLARELIFHPSLYEALQSGQSIRGIFFGSFFAGNGYPPSHTSTSRRIVCSMQVPIPQMMQIATASVDFPIWAQI